MFMNHADTPSKRALTEVMRKVNALGHAPRVVVELDKFVYVPGLKKKYDVIEYITKETTKNVVSIVTPEDGEYHANKPVMPIEGKSRLEDMVITSRHRTVNTSRPNHKGLDLDLEKGDPVVAVWDGTVTEVRFNDGGYGKYVTIDHGNGVKTRYAHLDAQLVNEGQIVKAGQRVGLGGNTGRVITSGGGDGSHLHFEVWKDGLDLDPEKILNGSVTINGVTTTPGAANGTGSVVTITKTVERTSYSKDLHAGVDGKFVTGSSDYFTVSTPLGAKRVLGFNGLSAPGMQKTFVFRHHWFNEGYLSFTYYYKKIQSGDEIRIKMDGKTVWVLNGNQADTGIGYPAPITVPRGEHVFEISMRNTLIPQVQSVSQFGIMTIKAAEFAEIQEQEVIPSTYDEDAGYRSTVWDFKDGMEDASKWTPINNTAVHSGGEYIYFLDNDLQGAKGIERRGEVKFPFTMQFRTKMTGETHMELVTISDGNKAFRVRLTPDTVSDGVTREYPADNTEWQEYMLVCEDENNMKVFIREGTEWKDTGLKPVSEDDSVNRVEISTTTVGTGVIYVDDVKYVTKNYSVVTPITTKTTEMRETPQWYELGGFVFDETFYLEHDIMEWEVSTHLDMSSATARVTLSNHHGLYSPEYVRDTAFPENMRKNPYTYYEEGEVRHVISEYTPVRIYAGYGDHLVRVFTGMIKGEIEEDSEARTITFNCVDRFDLLEECILLKEMSFPPAESFNGDSQPRPWIKSSIVQALANHAGMTGWRYVYEDLMHPDLVIEETYYTDINQSNNTFMKFNSQGVLEQVTLNAKTPNGYKNPFVESIVFSPGERVSDCIRRIVDEINFRVYVNRYGTFVMHRLDFNNNMRWNFRSGENLYSLNSSTDYSRVRNHIIVTGSHGNKEHFFDKDLLVATKGHIRTTQLDCPWIDESNGSSAYGAKKVVADKLFFDMKRQARTKEVVVKGNPFIEVLDGCYVYDSNTSTAGYYIIKGNTLIGNQEGMINRLELTWEEKV